MVNIILVVFLVSEPSGEEEPASDVLYDETELAGENITLHIANTGVILLTSKITMATVTSKFGTVSQEGLVVMTT